MSAPEPTAEHIAEAVAALHGEGDPIECLARALAAAEARGFERGQREERAAVVAWLEAEGDFATADKIEHNAHVGE